MLSLNLRLMFHWGNLGRNFHRLFYYRGSLDLWFGYGHRRAGITQTPVVTQIVSINRGQFGYWSRRSNLFWLSLFVRLYHFWGKTHSWLSLDSFNWLLNRLLDWLFNGLFSRQISLNLQGFATQSKFDRLIIALQIRYLYPHLPRPPRMYLNRHFEDIFAQKFGKHTPGLTLGLVFNHSLLAQVIPHVGQQ